MKPLLSLFYVEMFSSNQQSWSIQSQLNYGQRGKLFFVLLAMDSSDAVFECLHLSGQWVIFVEVITWAFLCELVTAQLLMGRRGPFTAIFRVGHCCRCRHKIDVARQKWGLFHLSVRDLWCLQEAGDAGLTLWTRGRSTFQGRKKNYIRREQDGRHCLLQFSRSVVILQPKNNLQLDVHHFLLEQPGQFRAGCLQNQNSSPTNYWIVIGR